MKKSNWKKALFRCFCVSLLFLVICQISERRIMPAGEAVFCIICLTLSFYMWYGIGVIAYKYVKNQNSAQGGSPYNSGRREPKYIVAAEIIDVQYKTKVKTNYPKAFIMSALGRRAYGPVGGILGAASGSRLETTPKKVLFAVLYSDGTQKTEKVNYDSIRFRTLMRYVEE